MKHLALATLGHVDHGKTALVRALTGVETDRLPEERERGISIALGHAHLAFDEGIVAIIDVPGHERFIRTMVSGAAGATAALLVIDVRESLRPQTFEHAAIARVLGIAQFVVAITKCDGVPESVRDAVAEEARAWLAAAGIDSAPIVFTSATTSEGVDTLRAHIHTLFGQARAPRHTHAPYLPIDRVFSVKGHGTVVTGTLRGGPIRAEDSLELLPDGHTLDVRSLQSYGDSVDAASPGHRVAANVKVPRGAEVSRGKILANPDSFALSRLFDAWLEVLPSAHDPLPHDAQVHVLFGASEVMARVRLLEGDELPPGSGGYVQLVCDRPAAAPRGLPFIVRGGAPLATLGGGTLLAPAFRKSRRRDRASAIPLMDALRHNDTARILALATESAGVRGIGQRDLQRRLGIGLADLDDPARFPQQRRIAGRWFDGAAVSEGESLMLEELAQWHRARPEQSGMPLAQWGGDLDDALRQFLREKLSARHRVRVDGGRVSLVGKSGVAAPSPDVLDAIERAYREGGSAPPHVLDVVGDSPTRRRALRALVNAGALVPIYVANKPNTFEQSRVFHRDSIHRAWRAIVVAFGAGARFDVQDVKETLGVTRKHAIPLVEYFDAQGWTIRQPEGRGITPKGIQIALGLVPEHSSGGV